MQYTVKVYESLESTNLTAKTLAAQGAKEGVVIIARKQERGRGRLGRQFFSPMGTGLYMSIVLRPSGEVVDALNITTAAAVAVAQAIEEVVGESVGIKWVNDIYYRDRKVCGILAEGGMDDGKLSYVILGIGVNISPPKGGFPADIAQKAGALFDSPQDQQPLLQAILRHFDECYQSIGSRSLLEEYRRRSWLDGKQVQLLAQDDTPKETVTVLGIGDDFSLMIKKDDEVLALRSGDVSVVPVK